MLELIRTVCDPGVHRTKIGKTFHDTNRYIGCMTASVLSDVRSIDCTCRGSN